MASVSYEDIMTASSTQLTWIEILLAFAAIEPRLEDIRKHWNELKQLDAKMQISIGKILEENARKIPDHPAIFFEEIKYTHSEFNALVNQYSNYFLE